MSEGLLDELLMVDLSLGVAGAYCCLLFAHLGAEVIAARPPIPSGRTKVLPYISDLSAGKKSVTLDTSKLESVDLLLHLAEHSDVLATDAPLPPDLDYATLSRQNPRLVLTVVTPPDTSDLFAHYLTGLNAFAATMLPLVNMSILGRGQEVRVDGAECIGATAFAVDSPAAWPHPTGEPLLPPFQVHGLTELSPAPRPGEHNDEVYCGLLGLSDGELARFKEAGVV